MNSTCLTLRLILFAIFIFNGLYAQQFCATVDAGVVGSGIVQDNNGNSFISGLSTSPNKNILVKLNENAGLEWVKQYAFIPPTAYENSRDLIMTRDGDLIGVGIADVLQVYKTDNSGNMKWARRISQVSEVCKVLELIDGSLIVAGNSANDVTIIKLDQNGNTIWSKLYGAPNIIEYVNSAILENDSLQFSLIGRADSCSWITRFDSAGVEVSGKCIGPNGDYHELINTSDGGKAFCFYDWFDNIYFGKLKSNNTIAWLKTKKYNPISIWVGLFSSVLESSSGDLVYCYFEDQVGSGPCILTMDFAGNFISAHIIDNYIEKLIKAQDGGIMGVGRNYTTGKIQVSKFDPQLNSCCYLPSVTVTFNNDSIGNVNFTKPVIPVNLSSQVVTATSVNISGYTLDCYVPLVSGIGEVNSKELSMFPNPVQDELFITSDNIIGQLKIYNSLGESILETAINKNEDRINVDHLTSGIYFLDATGKRLKFVKN